MTHHETHYRSGSDEEHPIEIEPRQARGARKGVPILYVLLASMALAIIVLLGIGLGFHAIVH